MIFCTVRYWVPRFECEISSTRSLCVPTFVSFRDHSSVFCTDIGVCALATTTTTTTTTGRTQLHKNKKLAKIAIEHLFSLDTTVDRPCLTEVARLLVAAGQKCKSMGYQWGELGDEMDDVWWLELLYDEDVQQRLKSIKELGENAATNRGGSVDELCGLIGDIELLTVNSPVGTMM